MLLATSHAWQNSQELAGNLFTKQFLGVLVYMATAISAKAVRILHLHGLFHLLRPYMATAISAKAVRILHLHGLFHLLRLIWRQP